jgi:hypothetical protein
MGCVGGQLTPRTLGRLQRAVYRIGPNAPRAYARGSVWPCTVHARPASTSPPAHRIAVVPRRCYTRAGSVLPSARKPYPLAILLLCEVRGGWQRGENGMATYRVARVGTAARATGVRHTEEVMQAILEGLNHSTAAGWTSRVRG